MKTLWQKNTSPLRSAKRDARGRVSPVHGGNVRRTKGSRYGDKVRGNHSPSHQSQKTCPVPRYGITVQKTYVSETTETRNHIQPSSHPIIKNHRNHSSKGEGERGGRGAGQSQPITPITAITVQTTVCIPLAPLSFVKGEYSSYPKYVLLP